MQNICSVFLRRFILTEENFKYRTNPLFLRNDFDSKEEWAMPVIPKPQSDITVNSALKLIVF